MPPTAFASGVATWPSYNVSRMKVLKQRNCSVLANQMRKLEMRQNKNCLPSGGGTKKALSAVQHDFQLENQNMKDLSGGKMLEEKDGKLNTKL